MPTPLDGPLEHLDDAECRRLLATARLGRLGFTDGALPAIIPVALAVHDGSVYIPARRDGSVMSAVRGAVVALQVDSFQDAVGPGWSVTAVGPARTVRHPEVVAEIDSLDLFPAVRSRWDGYVTVQPGLLHGWRASTAEAVHLRPPA